MIMKKSNDIKKEVIDVIGFVRGDEDGWGIGVAKIRWNDDPTTVNIRNMNLSKDIIGKGISISDYEAELLTNLLVRNDYGDIEELKDAISRRKFVTDYGEIINENEKMVFRVR